MIKPEQVPDAVAKELQREFDYQGVYVSLPSAAKIAAAALNAWPGVTETKEDDYYFRGLSIILPLPQEKTDD